MAACRLELRQNEPLERKFERLQREIDPALYLIVSRLRASHRIFRGPGGTPTDETWSTGTAFLADDAGRLLTCKHVVQPWKFPELAAALAKGEGVQIVDFSFAAIPAGHVYRAADSGSMADLLASSRGAIKIVATGADDLRPTVVDGISCMAESSMDNDVAVLQIKPPQARPLRLASEEDLARLRGRKLWPVMVAGFPLGVKLFEGGKVESSMTLGNVRKFERLLQHSAATCGGNSGGPLIDEDGRVVGIVSYMLSGSSIQNLNVCIPVTRVRELLGSGR